MVEISLKGEGWGGISYEGKGMPTTGRFLRLNGLYVSKDAQELLRYPGFALAAEPGYAEKYDGTWVGGTPTTFNVLAASSPHEDYTMLPSTATETPVYRASGASGNNLDAGWYPGLNVASGKSLTVSATSSGSSSGTDYVYISRIIDESSQLRTMEAMEVTGAFCIIADMQGYFDATLAAAPVDQPGATLLSSLGSWVSKRRLSTTTPLTAEDFVAFPSVVFKNIVRDRRWVQWTTKSYRQGTTIDYFGRKVPRKPQVDAYDGRVMIAAPGYGCMFEVDFKNYLLETWTTAGSTWIPGVTDALGVPKAACLPESAAVNPIAGTGISIGDSIYYRFAYWNPRSNAWGLVSDLFFYASTIAAKWLEIKVAIPQWILRETNADYIYLFASTKNGSPTALKPVDSVGPVDYGYGTADVDPIRTFIWSQSKYDAASNTPAPPRFPDMPMGALWCKNMRGWLFSGGRIGSNLSEDFGIETFVGKDQTTYFDVLGPMQVAGTGIPTSYNGVLGRLFGTAKSRLESLRNVGSGSPFAPSWNKEIDSALAGSVTDIPIQMFKGHIQYSPLERPGETTSIQRIIADRMQGIDVIACGKFANYLVFCTDIETYVLSWGRDPSGADPVLFSTDYGAICPVMIETDIGLTWLSDRGPVLFDGGSVQWIGKAVSARFDKDQDSGEKKYLRDDRRFMWNARGYYDQRENLVHWFLRTDAVDTDFADASGDVDDQTKVGCDSILSWSTRTGGWSTYDGQEDLKITAATESTMDDGLTRMAVVSDRVKNVADDVTDQVNLQGAVYAADPSYFDHLTDPIEKILLATPETVGSDIYAYVNSDMTPLLEWKDVSGFLETRRYQAFIRSITPDSNGHYALRWWGTIEGIKSTSGTDKNKLRISTPSGQPTPSWSAGDTIEIGVINCEFETIRADLSELFAGELKRGHKVKGLILDHRFEKSGSTPVIAWAFVEAYSQGVWTRLHSSLLGMPLDTNRETTRIFGGAAIGRETALRMTIISNARIRLRDIRLDVEAGG